jgi:uncharacterized membrane-anchored protein YhcB (DUF1043 family)
MNELKLRIIAILLGITIGLAILLFHNKSLKIEREQCELTLISLNDPILAHQLCEAIYK